MATKNRSTRRKQATTHTQTPQPHTQAPMPSQHPTQQPSQPLQAATPKQAPQPTPPAPAALASQPTARAEAQAAEKNVIHKGIYLSALVYIEGDMPAPQDFAGQATAALKSALNDALKGDHNGLSMTLKQVEVQNNVEDSGGDGESKGGKFQF